MGAGRPPFRAAESGMGADSGPESPPEPLAESPALPPPSLPPPAAGLWPERLLHGIEALAGRGLDATLLAPQPPGRPLGGLQRAELPAMSLRAGWLAGSLRLRGPLARRQVVLALHLPDPEAAAGRLRLWHRAVAPGDLCLIPPGLELDACLHGRARFLLLAVPPGQLRVALRQMTPADGFAPDATPLLRGNAVHVPAIGAAALRRIAAALAIQGQFGAGLSPRARQLLRTELLEACLQPLVRPAAAGAAAIAEASAEPVMSGAYIVRLVEDYLTVTGAAAGGELPDIDTICTAFRLSRRSLARAFQDSLGVGPMTYIRLLRLSQTRRALLAARRHGSSSPGGSSQAEGAAAPGVTGIALGHGFTELGRFAQLYRRMFGETPSETLRARH